MEDKEKMQNIIDEDNTDFEIINDWNEEEKKPIKVQDIEVAQYIDNLQQELSQLREQTKDRTYIPLTEKLDIVYLLNKERDNNKILKAKLDKIEEILKETVFCETKDYTLDYLQRKIDEMIFTIGN